MKNRLYLIAVIISVVLSSCSTDKDESYNQLDYYGNELYNASFAYSESGENKHVIPLMSKLNIKDAVDVQVSAIGGSFDLDYIIEDGQYALNDYHLYRICLFFSNVVFDKDIIEIKSIDLFYNDGKRNTLSLDKCQFVRVSGERNDHFIIFNGTPIRIPSDAEKLPLELSSEDTVTIKNIYLTNPEMIIKSYQNVDGKTSESFSEFTLSNMTEIMLWNAILKIGDAGLDKYKHYGTSVIVEYIHDGMVYYCTPPMQTIYNPFDAGFSGIERYFDYLSIK